VASWLPETTQVGRTDERARIRRRILMLDGRHYENDER